MQFFKKTPTLGLRFVLVALSLGTWMITPAQAQDAELERPALEIQLVDANDRPISDFSVALDLQAEVLKLRFTDIFPIPYFKWERTLQDQEIFSTDAQGRISISQRIYDEEKNPSLKLSIREVVTCEERGTTQIFMIDAAAYTPDGQPILNAWGAPQSCSLYKDAVRMKEGAEQVDDFQRLGSSVICKAELTTEEVEGLRQRISEAREACPRED